MAYELSDADQVRMLRKLLLYWDGQWFLKTVEEFGLETAIRMNARVRSAFGRIEMRLLLRTIGKPRAEDLPDAMHLIDSYAHAFLGDTLRVRYELVNPDTVEIQVHRCAAYEGAKAANLERVDQACIACETLWNAWFETLLPNVTVEVQYPMRMGKGAPHCHFIIRVTDQQQAQAARPC
ncbi:MAG: L-2-amino-thiazoline-4-carboxylic acid hydrolase [Anaerolineae bacterium]|jgi:hypothetical protein|nr:L-2-amino-thiazoline-4-carboxylic acid hydrolase [Anaerolineae bacterium]MDH7472629.1 L-2-amino-thiazoline-4-carboxylic acid hydrolase [Anaerolineae bacterium]